MKKTIQYIRPLLLCLAMVLLISTVSAVGAEQITPLYGGTLVTETWGTPKHFIQPLAGGPHFYTDWMIFSQLISIPNANPGVPGIIGYQLAKDWGADSTGTIWTFHLFQNFTWHDGEAVTSADVKFTYEYIMGGRGQDTPLPGAGLFSNVDHIDTPDTYTVVITLKTPDATLLYKLGAWTGYTFILPMHIFDGTVLANNSAIRNPIGCGPFKFSEYVEGDYIKVVANENFAFGRPYLDAIIWKIIPDASVMLAMLESGEIDAICNRVVPYSEVGRILKDPDLRVVSTPFIGGTQWYFDMNNQLGPFQDLRVRKALSLAINREEINQLVFRGLQTAAKYYWTSEMPWCLNTNATESNYNATLAEELLDEAGYVKDQDGYRFSFTITFCQFHIEDAKAIAALLKERLGAIGITVNYQGVEDAIFYAKAPLGTYDACLRLDYNAPDPYTLEDLYGAGKSKNYCMYNNSRVDELVILGHTTVDQDTRKAYYYEVQDILARDIPNVMLIEEDRYLAASNKFQGMFFDPAVRMNTTQYNFRLAWWTLGTETPTSGTTQNPGLDMNTILIIAIAVAAVVVVLAAAMIYRRRKHTTK